MPGSIPFIQKEGDDGVGLLSAALIEGGTRDVNPDSIGSVPAVGKVHGLKMFDLVLNESGGSLAVGDVVCSDASGTDPRTSVLKLGTADSGYYMGVVVDAAIPDDDCGRIQWFGICERANMPNATTAGTRLQVSATAGAFAAAGANEPYVAVCIVAPTGTNTYGVVRLLGRQSSG